MILEQNVSEILQKELPELHTALTTNRNAKSIYTMVDCFASHTRQLITKENFAAVKHCFNLAEKMLQEGNAAVKNAIENVYIHSIGIAIGLSASTAKQLKAILNDSLKKEYYKQVHAGGI